MCLTINKHYHKQPFKAKIAKEDIKIYKVLDTKLKKLKSPYKNFKWKLNEVFTSDLIFDEFYYSYEINEGLHSFSKINKNTKDYFYLLKWDSCKLFEGYIPKGSNYFIGKNNEIVSDQLILTKECENKEFKTLFEKYKNK